MSRNKKSTVVLNLSCNGCEKALFAALLAYIEGMPVVVFAPNKAILHGEETLKGIIAANVPISCFTVTGIIPELFNASDWPDMLESAYQVFIRGGTFGDSFVQFVKDGIVALSEGEL
jgi:hypothetical protein